VSYVPPSKKANIDTLVFEQPLQGSEIIAEVRKMVLLAEAKREGVQAWIDAVLHEVFNLERMLFVARFHRILAGYMILKPRDQKISTIWVEPKFRGWGIAQKFYGMGFVNLGIGNPYTAFVPDMLAEMRPLAAAYSLVLDDIGPLCVLNPDDREPWAQPVVQPPKQAVQTKQTHRSKPPAWCAKK
jgi:hypothetical protein